MITLHHAPGTRGFRIIWLCQELGIPCRLRKVDFSAEYRSSPEWLRMNPVGKVPVMEIGDLRLFESGAMVLHLLNRYGEGRLQPPADDDAHGIFLQWCWFAEATFGRATGEMANHKRAFAGALKADAMEEMAGRARACVSALEEALSRTPYLCGDSFTAADIMMGYTMQSFARHVGDALPPAVTDWWQRLQARPAFTAAIDAEQSMS